MDASLSVNTGAEMSGSGGRRGGWIISLIVIGTVMCLTLAAGGWQANLIVYLIREYNVKSCCSDSQISNVINGCTNLFPVIGSIIADSFLGCFPVIFISSGISLLGMVLFTLTATVDSLRPPACENGSISCRPPSRIQFAVLYASIDLASSGVGGDRFTIATIGANQFDKPKYQGIFFNWFFFTLYTASVISATAIVYIEDNVSWGLGFGLCAVANLIGLIIFFMGSHLYHHDKPQCSPFMSLARVMVAVSRKGRSYSHPG